MELATTQCMLPRVGEMAETGELHCDQHVDVLCQQLYQLQQQQVLCDVIINVDDMYIGAHSSVLAACSVTLNRMLMTEVLHMQNTRPLKLNVKDVNINSLTEILRFMYTGRLSLTPLTVKQIMACCEKWGLQKAIDLCSEFMWPNVSRGCGVNVSDTQTNDLQYNEDNVGGNSDYDQVNPGHQGDLIDMKNPVSLHPVVISQDSCYGQDNTGMPSLLYATVKLEPQERLSVETPSGSTVPEHQLCLGQEPTRKKVGRPRRKLQNIEANKTQGIGPEADKEASDTFVIVNTEKHTVDVSGESMDTLDANTYTPDYPHLKLEVTEEEEMREKNGTIEVKTQEDDFSGQVSLLVTAEESCNKGCGRSFSSLHSRLQCEAKGQGNNVGQTLISLKYPVLGQMLQSKLIGNQMYRQLSQQPAIGGHQVGQLSQRYATGDPKSGQLSQPIGNQISGQLSQPIGNQISGQLLQPIGNQMSGQPSQPIATRDENMICEVCGHMLKSLNCLRRHECGKQFLVKQQSQAATTGNQLSESKSIVDEGLICEVCGQWLKSRNSLKSHEATQHGSGVRFACSVCGKTFYMKQAYVDHMNRHTGVKRYQCRLCHTRFRYQTSLMRHIRSNYCPAKKQWVGRKSRAKAGTGSIVCNECGNRFRDKNSLKTHKECKHGGKMFKCVCGKECKWRSTMRYHKKVCKQAVLADSHPTSHEDVHKGGHEEP